MCTLPMDPCRAPPPSITAASTNTATLAAINTWVSNGRVCRAAVPRYTFWAPTLAHSGQWKPTDAWFMHRGQIGRSHRWQITPAGWSGCR